MDGLLILDSYMYWKPPAWVIFTGALLVIVATMSFVMCFDSSSDHGFTFAGISLLLLIAFILGVWIFGPNCNVKRMKVYSDALSFGEIADHYDVVGAKGNMLIIEEKREMRHPHEVDG